MKRPAKKMNTGNMVIWTSQSAEKVKHICDLARKVTSDPDKSKRMDRQECIACFYGSRIGGSTVTTQPCMSCGEDQVFASTNTDALCIDCARRHDLCKHCGGDVKMRVRRRKWPVPVGAV